MGVAVDNTHTTQSHLLESPVGKFIISTCSINKRWLLPKKDIKNLSYTCLKYIYPYKCVHYQFNMLVNLRSHIVKNEDSMSDDWNQKHGGWFRSGMWELPNLKMSMVWSLFSSSGNEGSARVIKSRRIVQFRCCFTFHYQFSAVS